MASDEMEFVPPESRRASQSTQASNIAEQQQQQHQHQPPSPRPTSALRNVQFRSSTRDNPPAIRLRRVRSLRPESSAGDGNEQQYQQLLQQHQLQQLQQQQQQQEPQQGQQQEEPQSPNQWTGRRRSSSEPHRRWFMSEVAGSGSSSPRAVAAPMPSVPERGQTRARSQSHNIQAADFQPFQGQGQGARTRPGLFRQVTNMVPGRRGSASQGNETEDDEYDADIVDILDVVGR